MGFNPEKALVPVDLMSLAQITALAATGAYLVLRDLDDIDPRSKAKLIKMRETLPMLYRSLLDPAKRSDEDFDTFCEALSKVTFYAGIAREIAVSAAQAQGLPIPPEFDPSRDQNVRPDPFERGEM